MGDQLQVDLAASVKILFGDLLLQIAELRAVNDALRAQLSALKPADTPVKV